jgi:hypothetical protein
MTYDELVTNIRNYTEVDANVFSASVINTFITMAENRILRDIDLDVFKLEAAAFLTTNRKFLKPHILLDRCLGQSKLFPATSQITLSRQKLTMTDCRRPVRVTCQSDVPQRCGLAIRSYVIPDSWQCVLCLIFRNQLPVNCRNQLPASHAEARAVATG